MSIKVNSCVEVVSDDLFFFKETGRGKVVRLYDDMGIAIVRFENGQVSKIPVDLLKEIEQENENQETEIPEVAKRITKDEFIEAVMIATRPDNMLETETTEKDPFIKLLGGISATITGVKIADEIFKDQDVVTMTEDQFISALWDGCNPVKLGNGVDRNTAYSKCLSISIMIVFSLKNTIKILFDDGSDNA